MATFRRQDRAIMKQRADAARKNEERRGGGGGGGDAAWYKLDFGTTMLRILPPFSDRGVIIKEFFEHGWLPPSSTQGPFRGKGGSRRAICLGKSFPERDAKCLICQYLDEAEKAHRGIARGLWAGRKCHINAIVISHTDPQGNVRLSADRSVEEGRYKPYIIQIPGGVANWIEIQQDTNDMDFADPEHGINISITKAKTGPEAVDVKYTQTTDVRGPSLMAPREMWDSIAEAMKDLDIIYGWPRDEKLAHIAQTAQIVKGYLEHKASKTAAGAAGGGWQAGSNAGGGWQAGAGTGGGGWQAGANAPADTGKADAVTKAYSEQSAPSQPAGGMAPPASLADAQKTGTPDCFAGARPHTGSEDEDYKGALGWQEDYTKCIICTAEVACQAASAEKGLVQVSG